MPEEAHTPFFRAANKIRGFVNKIYYRWLPEDRLHDAAILSAYAWTHCCRKGALYPGAPALEEFPTTAPSPDMEAEVEAFENEVTPALRNSPDEFADWRRCVIERIDCDREHAQLFYDRLHSPTLQREEETLQTCVKRSKKPKGAPWWHGCEEPVMRMFNLCVGSIETVDDWAGRENWKTEELMWETKRFVKDLQHQAQEYGTDFARDQPAADPSSAKRLKNFIFK
eukprot:TRINITY_DN74770_c0_g1_i1.p1 TRINITY_DN74770_c0_g1~~TRINITY_DN74770_c0_g1_i1.p1  ORF type:complete len:244 (+),score=5.49 TRINITY_DN74770_c0_g1_i1:56-733(+)